MMQIPVSSHNTSSEQEAGADLFIYVFDCMGQGKFGAMITLKSIWKLIFLSYINDIVDAFRTMSNTNYSL